MDSSELAKADQIGFHFYTKLVQVVNHARTSSSSNVTTAATAAASKVDKWFNLETPDSSDLLSREIKDRYRHFSAQNIPLPLEIQVLLTIPDLSKSSRVLVHGEEKRSRIQPAPRSILLERWSLTFQPDPHHAQSHATGSTHSAADQDDDFSPPTMYKHAICYFRSIYSLLRILPSWSTCKKLKSKRNNGGGLGIRVHVPSSNASASYMDFDTPLSASVPTPTKIVLPRQTHTFPPFLHPAGAFHLKVEYLEEGGSDFRLEELESVLSDRLRREEFEQDARFKWEAQIETTTTKTTTTTGARPTNDLEPGVGHGWRGPTTEDLDFVPTLTKNQQRDSLLSSAGGGAGASTARSPPIPISAIRERRLSGMGGVGTSHSASTSPPKRSSPLSTSPGMGIGRASSAAPSGSGIATLAARLRKESLPATPLIDASSSSLTSGSASGSTTRRPPLTINPFKSNTVSQAQSPVTHLPPGVGSLGTSASSGSSIPVIPGHHRSTTTPPGSATGVAFPGVGGGSSYSSSPRLTSSPRAIPLSLSGAGGTAGGTSSASPASGRLSTSPPNSHSHRPFAPSSLSSVSSGPPVIPSAGAGAAGTGAESPTVQRKRYSSSFGHRYSSSGGAAVGNSSPIRGSSSPSRGGSPRMLSTTSLPPPNSAGSAGGGGIVGTEDEEALSSFVKDIERRRPLGGGSVGGGGIGGGGSGSEGLLVPHTQPEIDQKLADLNEAFFKSLEGLGSGRRRSSLLGGSGSGASGGGGSGEGSGQGSSEIVGKLEYS
ncbi:autophagy-related protein 13-domain-containing protein [Flagelloscypha sp. PMI_526]|nr:autophagy-related protein 13-domain-containing protein [Flagelloscypha sp. PMI_526]